MKAFPYEPSQLNILNIGDPAGQYRNLADLYYRPVDPITELVQNSLAAVLERQKSEPGLSGMIEVLVDPIGKRLEVRDNGTGFQSLQLVGANRTTRSFSQTPYSGFGIGLSAVIARSDYFAILSINLKKEVHFAEWKNVRESLLKVPIEVTDFAPSRLEPEKAEKAKVETFVEVRGEGFSALWELGEGDPQTLYEMIMCHTALGHVAWIWKESERPNCRYRVRVQSSKKEPVNQTGQIGFQAVRVGEAKTFNFEDYKRLGSFPPSSDHLIIYQKLIKSSEPKKPCALRLYVACEVTRGTIIPQRFPKYLESLVTHRIIPSIGGFPQSFNLEQPPEKMTRALWGNILAVVDADQNVVEPGRNKISDRYLSYIQGELRNAVKELDGLASEVRQREEGRAGIDAEDEKKNAVAMARKNALSFSIGFDLALKKVPDDEMEVVALFVELLARGAIQRTEILRLGGSSKTYDQYLRYSYSWADVGRNKRKRPEGRRKLDLKETREKILISEFKLEASRLAVDLERKDTRKRIDQIDLLVCWSEGSLPKGWRLLLLAEEDKLFSAATHRLAKGEKLDDTNSCECVVLEEFLRLLEERSS